MRYYIMRKILNIILLAHCLIFASCISSAQVVGETYVEYTDYIILDGHRFPVFYINTIPYYRMRHHDHWVNYPVPHREHIKHYDRPRHFNVPDRKPREIRRDQYRPKPQPPMRRNHDFNRGHNRENRGRR